MLNLPDLVDNGGTIEPAASSAATGADVMETGVAGWLAL